MSNAYDSVRQLDPRIIMELHGSKPYLLEFTNKQVKRVHKELGVNLLVSAITQDQLRDPEFISKFLLIALEQNQPDVTEDEVDRILTIKQIPYIFNCLIDALDLFYPEIPILPISSPNGGGQQDPQ